MYIYYIVLLISLVFSIMANNAFSKNEEKKGIIYLIFMIIPLVILAGLRSIHIGFDVDLYAVRIFNKVSDMSLSELFSCFQTETLESGFVFVIYLLCKIVKDIHFVLFGLQLLISLSFIRLVYFYRKKVSISIMLVIYFCTLYIRSYDLLRQGLAIAAVMQMLIFYEKKNYIKCFLYFILELTLHNSAIFAIIIPLVMMLCDTKKINKKTKNIINLFCIVLFTLIVYNYQNISYALYNAGVLSHKYLFYIDENSSFMYSKVDIRWSITIIKAVIILVSFIYLNVNNISLEEKNENRKWFIFLLYDFVINFLTFKIRNFDRIALYFYYPSIFIFCPQLVKIAKNDKYSRVIVGILIAGLFLADFTEKMITNRYNLNPYIWMFNE